MCSSGRVFVPVLMYIPERLTQMLVSVDNRADEELL